MDKRRRIVPRQQAQFAIAAAALALAALFSRVARDRSAVCRSPSHDSGTR
jgi:hypothetical protein